MGCESGRLEYAGKGGIRRLQTYAWSIQAGLGDNIKGIRDPVPLGGRLDTGNWRFGIAQLGKYPSVSSGK